MYHRILIATDGSVLSNKAVSESIRLAAATGAELVALYVVPRYPTSYFEGGSSISDEEVARTEDQWAQRGQSIVDAVRAAAGTAGVRSEAVLARSDLVAESILAAAAKHRCDLIVMASHGHRGVKRVLLGSETQHVLTHSDIPVLVLR